MLSEDEAAASAAGANATADAGAVNSAAPTLNHSTPEDTAGLNGDGNGKDSNAQQPKLERQQDEQRQRQLTKGAGAHLQAHAKGEKVVKSSGRGLVVGGRKQLDTIRAGPRVAAR